MALPKKGADWNFYIALSGAIILFLTGLFLLSNTISDIHMSMRYTIAYLFSDLTFLALAFVTLLGVIWAYHSKMYGGTLAALFSFFAFFFSILNSNIFYINTGLVPAALLFGFFLSFIWSILIIFQKSE